MRIKSILLFLFCFLCMTHAQEKLYVVDVETVLNVRETPNANAKVLFTIPDRRVVVPTSIENGWAKVTIDGQTGYISEKYIRESVSQNNQAEGEKKEWNFRSWFEDIVSLKLCYTLIIILLILNWIYTIAIPRDEQLGTRCGLYIALLCMMLLTYFGQDMKDLVNHHWTGGWLDGYFLAFVNAIVLSASVVQLYNSFVGCSCAAAKKAIEGTDVKFSQLSIDFYLWFLPLAALIIFVALLLTAIPFGGYVSVAIILYTIYRFIKKTVVNYRLMKPHYWIATFIPLSGLITMICIALMIYVSFFMLLLGIAVCAFCMGAIRSAPSAVGQALDAATTPSDNSDEEEQTRLEEERNSQKGSLSWDNEYINDGNGRSNRITDVDSDGTIRDQHGGKWRDRGFGNYEKVN